ncbi:MAG: inositol monophosphatase family protein [bacterium]|nr:inositol monophosphatase family protein [bacterium]
MDANRADDRLGDEAARLRDIALAAGAIQLEGCGRRRDIAYKSATDMVTDVDRRVEAFLFERLGEDFPRDGVRAEEGTGRAGDSGRVWHVDPLDGTTNYVHGHPFYAVSLGCAGAGGPELGAVYAPALDELYLARRGGGATLERPQRGEPPRRLALAGPVALERALLATGFPYERGEVAALNCDLVKDFLLRPCHDVRRGGSAALDLCHVAAGRLDGYWEFRLQPWDVAAGVLVAREAGAVVTDLDGGDDALHGRHILAAAPGLHAVMLAIIRAGAAGHGLLRDD